MTASYIVTRNIKLLGAQRKNGDSLTREEFDAIPYNVRTALIGTGAISVSDSEEPGSVQHIRRLEARIDRLQNMVESLSGGEITFDDASEEARAPVTIDAAAEESASQAEDASTEAASAEEPVFKAKMSVSFKDSRGKVRTGVVRSVRKKKGTVTIMVGKTMWEVDTAEVTIA